MNRRERLHENLEGIGLVVLGAAIVLGALACLVAGVLTNIGILRFVWGW